MEIFTDEFLETIGFTGETEYDYKDFDGKHHRYKIKPPYGRAVSNHPKGMTVLQWNNAGYNCTYLGDALEDNISLTIYKDGGTRTVFNGYVFNKEQVLLLLKLTS